MQDHPDNKKKWPWQEMYGAPKLVIKPIEGIQDNLERVRWRSQAFQASEREESARPDFGQFDICFQHFVRIQGAFLQYEGEEQTTDKSRRIDMLALLEVRKDVDRRRRSSAGTGPLPSRRLSSISDSVHSPTQSRRVSVGSFQQQK
jgi:hypothetical protein